MTAGVANNWASLNIVGRVDVDALTVAGRTISGDSVLIPNKPPLTQLSPGEEGTITWDEFNLYICTSKDFWVRVSLNHKPF